MWEMSSKRQNQGTNFGQCLMRRKKPFKLILFSHLSRLTYILPLSPAKFFEELRAKLLHHTENICPAWTYINFFNNPQNLQLKSRSLAYADDNVSINSGSDLKCLENYCNYALTSLRLFSFHIFQWMSIVLNKAHNKCI